jgi:hypothetical protein
MKLKNYIYGVALGALSLTFASCYNADKEFPDYEGGTTAYFAYQFPVRTLILGNDIYDNSLDNAHKCHIWATMGGAYSGRDAVASLVIDETLCENLYFTDVNGNADEPVTPLPHDYYNYDQLKNCSLNYNGELRGYVEVQFTDAFFNDPNAIKNYYVIPLRMTDVSGIDHILVGKVREGLDIANTSRTNLSDWDIEAKDYVLYCVKYMNPWQGKYIRRGKDLVTEAGTTKEVIRKDMSLVNTDLGRYTSNPVNANDEVCSINTKNMTEAIFPVSFQTSGASISCNLILKFEGNKCVSITTDDENVTASGSGEYIPQGTARSEYSEYQWGSMDGELVQRDILRLDYNVDFTDKNIQVSTADTLVVQTRESNKKVFFSPQYIKP